MRVVFLEDVEGTADTGDVKNVADGFARNYLLPRKLAAPANGHYINIAQAKASKQARRQDRLDDEARVHLLPKVDGTTVRVEVRVGEQGKLFGSVTSRDIAEALREATKIEVEHQQVYLPQPLRELGSHEVTVKLTKNVHATVTVAVEPLGGVPEAETLAEAATEATAEPLVSETAAASEAQDADKRRQAEEGSQDTSAETGVGLEAGAEAAQVAAPQAVADVEAPDEQELEHTGEVD